MDVGKGREQDAEALRTASFAQFHDSTDAVRFTHRILHALGWMHAWSYWEVTVSRG